MILMNKLRYYTWLLSEKIKKDSIYKRMNNIKLCMEDDNYYNNFIDKALVDIIEYAQNNTKYYSSYIGKEFSQFPIIDKHFILKHIDSFKSKEFENQLLHEMQTTGSTGLPFKVYQDSGKRKQVLAEILYFSDKIGYSVGKKLIYLRNKESIFKVSKLKQFIKNEDMIATQKYDDDTLAQITKQLLSKEKGTTILGYASTLSMISTYMNKNNIFAKNISGIISGAEAINHKTRIQTEKQFNCKVVSRYSNQEMGILAQDYEEDEFEINRASYFIEILNIDNDQPAKIGEIGRIVVTDLYNKAMPLIRYDTGDLGIFSINESNKIYLSKVLGRKMDLLYTTKNEPISFFSLDEFFELNDNIYQYQIIQEDRYNLTVNIILKPNLTIDETYCINGVKSIMGYDCNVKLNYLDQLPISETGKFRYVICKYKPGE